MSNFHANGTKGQTIVYNNTIPQEVTENGEKSYIFRGWIRSAYLSAVPAEGSALSTDETYKLKRISLDPKTDTANVHDVVLTYNKTSQNSGGSWDKSVIERDANPIPVAVSVYDALIPDALVDQQYAAQDAGNKTMEVGGVTYQYTTYVSSFPWTAASLLTASTGEVVGQTGTPTGVTAIISETWKFKGNSVAQKGLIARVTENWEGSTVPFK
jgi:hypothetical protein